MKKTDSKERYFKAYAKSVGMTVEGMKVAGYFVVPCECGEPWCVGWKMCMK